MALLAHDLHKRNILLEDPFEEYRNKTAELEAAQVVEAVAVNEEEASYDSYPSPPPETESEEEDLSPMAPRRVHSSKARDEDALCSTMSSMKIGKDDLDLVGAVALRPCARPMLPTYWENWDEELCDVVGFAKIVMSLDPTTELDDLQLSWIDKRHFKIGIRWPPYLSNYFSLAEMDKDSTGELLFPRQHPSEIGFGKNKNKLKDENGEIFDHSIVFFPGKNMDTSIYEPKILLGKTKDKKGNEVPVKLLRIIFHEATKSGASKRIEIEESQDNTDLCKLGEKKEAASPQASSGMDVDSDEEEDDNNTSSTPFPTPFRGTPSSQTHAAVDPSTVPLPGSPSAGRIRPRDEFVVPRSGKKAKPTNAIVPLPSLSPPQDY